MPFHTVEIYSQYVRTSIYLLAQGLHGFVTQGEEIMAGPSTLSVVFKYWELWMG